MDFLFLVIVALVFYWLGKRNGAFEGELLGRMKERREALEIALQCRASIFDENGEFITQKDLYNLNDRRN